MSETSLSFSSLLSLCSSVSLMIITMKSTCEPVHCPFRLQFAPVSLWIPTLYTCCKYRKFVLICGRQGVSKTFLVQTLEGHDSSVLKVTYISNGRQLLSRYLLFELNIISRGNTKCLQKKKTRRLLEIECVYPCGIKTLINCMLSFCSKL